MCKTKRQKNMKLSKKSDHCIVNINSSQMQRCGKKL